MNAPNSEAQVPTHAKVSEGGEKVPIQAKVADIQQEAVHLMGVLQQVSESLSKRTSQATQLTVDHTAMTDNLVQVLTSLTSELQNKSQVFLNDVNGLRRDFDVIKSLAEKTALLRQQVVKLEARVFSK